MDSITPYITLLGGGVLGFASSFLLTKFRHKQSIAERLIEKYFLVRDELSEQLSSLANLESHNYKLNNFDEAKVNVGKLFYKHADFLPKELLDELACLHYCLVDPNHRIYVIDERRIRPIRDNELEGFLNDISFTSGFRIHAEIPLVSSNKETRESASISYQSIKTIKVMNSIFNIDNLMQIAAIGKQGKIFK